MLHEIHDISYNEAKNYATTIPLGVCSIGEAGDKQTKQVELQLIASRFWIVTIGRNVDHCPSSPPPLGSCQEPPEVEEDAPDFGPAADGPRRNHGDHAHEPQQEALKHETPNNGIFMLCVVSLLEGDRAELNGCSPGVPGVDHLNQTAVS